MTIGYQLEYTKKKSPIHWYGIASRIRSQNNIRFVWFRVAVWRNVTSLGQCIGVRASLCACVGVWYILWFIYWHTAWTKWARVEWICIVWFVSMQWIRVAPSIVHFHFMSRTRKSPSKTSQIPLAFLCSVQSFVFHDAYILQAIVLIGIIRILWNFEKSPKYTPDRKSAHCLTS